MFQRDAQSSEQELVAAFRAAGQAHVFRWWDEIGADGRRNLLAQIRTVDLKQLAFLTDAVKSGTLNQAPTAKPELPPWIPLPSGPADLGRRAAAAKVGKDLLRAGKVAAVMVAGGQGTRLNFDKPKGMFPIGPVSGKSLFEIRAEEILALRRRYGGPIPWFIMTSDATDAETRTCFDVNRCYGLPREDVIIFTQRMMPALDKNFRLVMLAKDRILMSPNGHGGTLLALHENGLLDDMARRGIEELSYFQVDNPLVPAADPVFLGFHRLASSQMSGKAIWKRDAEEPLGAFVTVAGRLTVIEYSDLTRDEKHETTPEGKLIYGLGSPAIHAINVDFIRHETASGFKLPYHLAEKRSEYLNEAGDLVRPGEKEKNVYKFETFIFDAFRDAARFIICEVRREEEFSPVKSLTGADSAESCRRDLISLHASRLESAGVRIPRDSSNNPAFPVEISPLYALDVQELAAKVPKDMKIAGPLYLAPDEEA